MTLDLEKRELDAMGGAEAYHYDPENDTLTLAELNREMQAARGLQKLHFIRDRSHAALLYELFWQAERYANSPRYERNVAREQRKSERERLELLFLRAEGGRLGSDAREAANLSGIKAESCDLEDLMRFERTLRQIQADAHGVEARTGT